jgi:MFS family permease
VNTTVPGAPRFAALQHRNFTLLWWGLIVSNVGTWMQNVAQGWLVLQLTNSPLWLGLLGLSFALPMIVLPLVGGAVTDRVHRIRLLYITQTGLMLNAFALALLTWLGVVNPWDFPGATSGTSWQLRSSARRSWPLITRRARLSSLSSFRRAIC